MKQPKQTNAERYRAQLATDERLAEFLMKAHDGEIYIPFCPDKGPCAQDDIDPMGEGCKACMMEWLNKAAEEGGNVDITMCTANTAKRIVRATYECAGCGAKISLKTEYKK